MKAKIYLIAGVVLANGFAFSQSHGSFKADTTLFNYSYWNGLSDKMHLQGDEKKEFLDGRRKLAIEEQEKEHYHGDDKDLVWVTHPAEKKFGSASTAAGPCTNIDFENGTMSSWVRSSGYNPLFNATGCCPNANGDQTIMSGTGVDPYGGFPVVYPGGGSFSLRLGSTTTGGRADRIQQTFFVTPQNANFTYRYAVVLNDGGHTTQQQPRFEIQMIDSLGNGIPCTFYNVSAGSNITGFQTSSLQANGDPVIYKPWTSVIIDLTPNIGQNVTLRFTVYDCSPSGHFAYAYIDGLCTNFDLAVSDTTCPNIPTPLCGPDGFGSYSWNGPGVTNNPNRCINVSAPGVYTCNTILVPGCPGPTFTHTLSNHPNPILSFTPNGASCSTQYSFNSTSSISAGSIASYTYSFGDNTGSFLQSPVHNYPGPGNYTVKFKAVSNLGCRDSVIQNVIVHPPPQITFSPPSHCINTPIQFTNTSLVPPVAGVPPGSITSYTWNFGNGQTSSLQNPVHTYTTSQNFIVTLTAMSDQGCVVSATQSLGIFPPPQLSFTANPLCDQNGSAFTPMTSTAIASGSIVGFYWQFGDGGTSNLQNPVHIYNTPGTYTVSYTGTSNHNCVTTVIDTLIISPTPTVALTTNSLNACSPQFTFNSNSIGTSSLNWSFIGPNPGNIVTSTLSNPTHTFPAIGNYTVMLVGTSGMGCRDTAFHNFTIYPLPVVSVSVPASCESALFTVSTTAVSGSVTSYLWNFGDPVSGPSNTSTAQNPTHSYAGVGSYVISLQIISNQNCPSFYTNTITVHPNPDPSLNFFPPDACTSTYTFVNNTGFIPLPPPGNSITSYSWNFGGTSTSTLFSPVHNFGGPGTYTVTLTALTNNNCSATETRTLEIHPYPQVNFSVTPACLNAAANFSASYSIPQPGSVVSFTWNFGDGSFDNSNPNTTSHSYATSTVYPVSYAVTSNQGCVSTKTAAVQIYPLPNFNFGYLNTCAGSPVTFSNNTSMPQGYSITNYRWDFESDGSTDSNLPSPVHTFTASGQYTVQLHATTSNNCSDSLRQTIIIHDLPTPVITINNVCAGQSTAFTASLSQPGFNSQLTGYTWDFGDNSGISSTPSGMHNYAAPGIYSVQLTATNNYNCSRQTSSLVTVHHLPVVNFTANSACLNSPTSFTNLTSIGNPDQVVLWKWDFGGGFMDSLSHSPVRTFANSGSYPVKLTAISNNNCSGSKTQNITIYGNPLANFTTSTVCVGDNITFQNQSSTIDGTITSSAWDMNGDLIIDQEQFTPVYTYSVNGTYIVKLEVMTNFGCRSAATKMVHANPKPVAVVSSDNTSGCPELCVNFKNHSYISGGSFTSQWDFGDGSPLNSATSPIHCYGEGDFDVRLTLRSDSGCRTVLNKSSFVKVFPNPTADFSVFPPEVDEEDPTITVQSRASSDAVFVRYYVSDGSSFGTDRFTHAIKNMDSKSKPMVVQIVKNKEGCVDTLYKVLEIKPAFAIYIPDAFTPNGDGNNDNFMAKGVGIIKFSMQVYDRWGHLVWNTETLEGGWDGTSGGSYESIKSDVYTWKAQVMDVFNQNHNMVGHVTLIK